MQIIAKAGRGNALSILPREPVRTLRITHAAGAQVGQYLTVTSGLRNVTRQLLVMGVYSDDRTAQNA